MSAPVKTEKTGQADKYREFFVGSKFVRVVGFKLMKTAMGVYRFYLEKFMNKPKSARIFADENLPIGIVRQSLLASSESIR